ncbi:MAG: hypothetical protein V5A28_13455, partial [Haloarculaceae archaeon]
GAAHGPDAVEVKSVEGDGDGEVGNLANYLADYLSVDPDTELTDRPIEFIAWAAAVWAADRNKRSRSVSAGDAIDADACRQQYRDPDTEQDHEHGERLRRDDGRGPGVVCAECGSGWGVPDAETVTEARLSDPGPEADPVTDTPKSELRSRWPSARAAAAVGMTPTEREMREQVGGYLDRNPGATVPKVVGALNLAPSKRELVEDVLAGNDPPDSVSFERPPEWQADAVIRGEDEYTVGGGGVDLVPLKLPVVDGRLLWDRPSGARFRCSVCNFSTYNPETMKGHAARHDAPPEKTVRHDFVSAWASPETVEEPTVGDRPGRQRTELSQHNRIKAVMSAVGGGATVDEIVASVDAPDREVRHTVEKLKRQGRLVETGNGHLHRA